MEIWKDIKGYEGLYQVSNMARVKSLEKKVRCAHGYRTLPEKVLKNKTSIGGYYYVNLYKDRTLKTAYVHKLVATAFIPNPKNKPQADHINTIRTDNRVENLQWVTIKENCNNPISKIHHTEKQLGKKNHMYGRKWGLNPKSKPIIQLTLDGKPIKEWSCAMEVREVLGINNGMIGSCCKGMLDSAGGYRWMYKN